LQVAVILTSIRVIFLHVTVTQRPPG